MTTIAIHQFVAGYTKGDAISNEARALRAIFREWGHESHIYCEPHRILPEDRKDARDVAGYANEIGPDDIVLLHLSVGSDVNMHFHNGNFRKAILYHNITPPHFFEMVNRQTAASLARGREQLALLKDTCSLNLADSGYNAQELREAGYHDPQIFPLVLDFRHLKAAADNKIVKRVRDGKTNILFVGRCAPNKSLEDLVWAFYEYHTHINPNSRFIHVGSYAGTERYKHYIQSQIRELGLDADFEFTGSVDQNELNAYYACADVFLIMSEHEGFCIPIIEAMLNDVPVLAYDKSAVPETMDGAGVLFHRKDFPAVAEMMGKLASPGAFRAAVIAGQQERLRRFQERNHEQELKTLLAPLLQAPVATA